MTVMIAMQTIMDSKEASEYYEFNTMPYIFTKSVFLDTGFCGGFALKCIWYHLP